MLSLTKESQPLCNCYGKFVACRTVEVKRMICRDFSENGQIPRDDGQLVYCGFDQRQAKAFPSEARSKHAQVP